MVKFKLENGYYLYKLGDILKEKNISINKLEKATNTDFNMDVVRSNFLKQYEILVEREKQQKLFDRIMDAKAAVHSEPWRQIVDNEFAQSIFEVEEVKA